LDRREQVGCPKSLVPVGNKFICAYMMDAKEKSAIESFWDITIS
jgi:NDP-sugar pyrophosphorylase family protein